MGLIRLDDPDHVGGLANGSTQLDIGASGGDGTGDDARLGGAKLKQWAADLNEMMAELYAASGLSSAGIPWVKVGAALSYSAWSATALSAHTTLFNLVPGGIIQGFKIKPSAAFGGPGVIACTVSIGVAGNLTKYASAFDVFQGVGSKVLELTDIFGTEDHVASTPILITLTTVGANLNALTAGVLDVWADLSVAA